MTAIDWSAGRYEATAEQLLPAAEVVVDAAGVGAGLRVLDIGCGTGNAAILAAQRGAEVIAVDPAGRLRDVATQRAVAAGVTVDVRAGAAASLPVDDSSIDVGLSVFAVIFAPDPQAAAAEIARVLAPTGRLVMTAWTPGGACAGLNRVAARLAREAVGAAEPPPPFPWHEESAVRELFIPHGFTVTTMQHPIAFTAATPEAAYGVSELSPVGVTTRRMLESAGRLDQLERIRAEAITVLSEHNEDPSACRVTSHYVVHVVTRG